ncbi:MAG TPA: MFS transporter [Dehalococcoidia bacterium]
MGPARPFAAGVALFAAGLMVAGAAPSMFVLVAGRAVQGLGAGVIPPVAYVVIGRNYEESLRPRMLAVLASAWVIPGLAGPVLAGAVAEYVSWRAVFIGLLPLLVVATALTLPALRTVGPPDDSRTTPTRMPKALRLVLGAALALGGIASGNVYAGALAVIVGLAIALPALKRLVPAGTLRAAPGVPASIAGMGLLNMAFFGADAFVPLMLTHVRGQSTLVAGLALTSGTLSWTAGSWILARSAGRIERRAAVCAGLLLVAAGIALMMLVLLDATPVALAAVAWCIAGLGMGLAYPAFSLSLLAGAAVAEQGVASSALKLNEALGAAIGAGAGGAIVAAAANGGWQAGGIALTFAALAGVAIVGLYAGSRIAPGTASEGAHA